MDKIFLTGMILWGSFSVAWAGKALPGPSLDGAGKAERVEYGIQGHIGFEVDTVRTKPDSVALEAPGTGKADKADKKRNRKAKKGKAKASAEDSDSSVGSSLKQGFTQMKEGVSNWFNESVMGNGSGDYAELQRQNNQVFADMLRQADSWASYPMTMDERSAYAEGRFFSDKTKASGDTSGNRLVHYGKVLEPHAKMESPVPGNYYEGAGKDAVSNMVSKQQFTTVKFYGQELKLVYEPSLRSIGFGKAQEKHIAKFWQYLASQNYDPVVAQLYQYKVDLGLNDYQYYQLVRAFATPMFEKGKKGEALGFTVFVLNQTGYDARLAKLRLEKKTEMVVLLPFWEKAFGLPYVMLDSTPYYLVDYKLSNRDMRDAEIQTYGKPFATAPHPFSFQINPVRSGMAPLYGKFEGYIYNERLAEMEAGLPAGPGNMYWEVPFDVLLEKTLVYRMKPDFDSLVSKTQAADLTKRLSESEKRQMQVLQLAGFLDRNLSSQAKRSARLTQYYLYPDLMFWKKGSGDIWDRSVLFCQIAKRIFDIPAVLLIYPDYAIPAVGLPAEKIPANSPFRTADYVEYNGKAYFLLGRIPKAVDTSVFPQLYVW